MSNDPARQAPKNFDEWYAEALLADDKIFNIKNYLRCAFVAGGFAAIECYLAKEKRKTIRESVLLLVWIFFITTSLIFIGK